MENVTKIVYKNNAYSLEGYDMQTALDLLHIDVNSVNMEVEGDTLYIMAKAGSKGVISLKDLDPNKKEEGRFAVKFVDGKLVKEEPESPKASLTLLKGDEAVKQFLTQQDTQRYPSQPTTKEVKHLEIRAILHRLNILLSELD